MLKLLALRTLPAILALSMSATMLPGAVQAAPATATASLTSEPPSGSALAALDSLPDSAQQQVLCAALYQAQAKMYEREVEVLAEHQSPGSKVSPLAIQNPELASHYRQSLENVAYLYLSFRAEQGHPFPSNVLAGAEQEVDALFPPQTKAAAQEQESELESCQWYLDNSAKALQSASPSEQANRVKSAAEMAQVHYAKMTNSPK